MGPRWSVVSGLSAAATIHTAAIAAVQPNTARSELAGVVIVVIHSKRWMWRMLIPTVIDGTVGGTPRSLATFLVGKRRENR
jgi:hypothetical protein